MRLEAWTLLAALAARTHTVRLGVLVTSIVFRHPALLAYQIATVDQISRGRLEIGIGAAGRRADPAVVGGSVWAPAERANRLGETVELLDRLLRGGSEFVGRYYRSAGAATPPSVQTPRPPLTIAAHGGMALGVVARFADRWISLGGFADTDADRTSDRDPVTLAAAAALTRVRGERLDRLCVEIGRDPASIRRAIVPFGVRPHPLLSRAALRDLVDAYTDAGISEIMLPMPVTAAQDAVLREALTSR